jgi:hypothetical protein
MQLIYTDPDETTIKVTLDEGETLDDLMGPTEAFVPRDEGNRHYQAILDDELTVSAYEAPVQAEEDTNGDPPKPNSKVTTTRTTTRTHTR